MFSIFKTTKSTPEEVTMNTVSTKYPINASEAKAIAEVNTPEKVRQANFQRALDGAYLFISSASSKGEFSTIVTFTSKEFSFIDEVVADLVKSGFQVSETTSDFKTTKNFQVSWN